MTLALTQAEIEERCLANGYRWPEGVSYEGVKKNYPLICLTCGDNTPKWFTNVGQNGCKKCHYVAQSLAQTLTHDEAVAQGLAADHPALLLEEYKGTLVKHLYLFKDCGHEWEIQPNNLYLGRGCGECFHDQGLTYLYLMEHQGLAAFKIGVTAVEHSLPTDSRIHRYGLDGWTLTLSVRFETRAEALKAEKKIIDSWREQGFPPALQPGQMRRGGEGETVSRQLVTSGSIKEKMRSDWYPSKLWKTAHLKASTTAAAANCV